MINGIALKMSHPWDRLPQITTYIQFQANILAFFPYGDAKILGIEENHLFDKDWDAKKETYHSIEDWHNSKDFQKAWDAKKAEEQFKEGMSGCRSQPVSVAPSVAMVILI